MWYQKNKETATKISTYITRWVYLNQQSGRFQLKSHMKIQIFQYLDEYVSRFFLSMEKVRKWITLPLLRSKYWYQYLYLPMFFISLAKPSDRKQIQMIEYFFKITEWKGHVPKINERGYWYTLWIQGALPLTQPLLKYFDQKSYREWYGRSQN